MKHNNLICDYCSAYDEPCDCHLPCECGSGKCRGECTCELEKPKCVGEELGQKCGVSSGIHEGLTFGTGRLDDNGYWEFPCKDCARRSEEKNPGGEECWPFPYTNICPICHRIHDEDKSCEEEKASWDEGEARDNELQATLDRYHQRGW